MSDTVHVCLARYQLRKRYESGVEERNSHGLSLIERNEELSIFYEKLNLQGMLLPWYLLTECGIMSSGAGS